MAAIAPFSDPLLTAKGEPRAQVALHALDMLWLNTGTLCNLACATCYIESSPTNDRLGWLTRADVRALLDEIARDQLPTRHFGLTGGEPFMNPEIVGMLGDLLAFGGDVLVLTNAMTPLTHKRDALLALARAYPGKLSLRVSLDHYAPEHHESERGPRSWQPALDGLCWLAAHGFDVAVAGRMKWGESEAEMRAGYAALFAAHGLAIDAADPHRLMLFPEMEAAPHVPEISTGCWDILNTSPDKLMCAHGRMAVRRRGAARATLVACTLLPYDPRFELGETLAEASRDVALNHPWCAQFCVLGGGSCS